jgi:hypothetical protein
MLGMKLITTSVPIVALSCCVAGSAIAAGAARLSAPSKAKVGDQITAKGSHLKSGGKYSLRLIFDGQPSEVGLKVTCAANLGTRHKPSGGKVTISGKIPQRMSCYQGNGENLGTITVMPGKYHLLLAVPNGPTGSSVKFSFVRKALTIKKS